VVVGGWLRKKVGRFAGLQRVGGACERESEGAFCLDQRSSIFKEIRAFILR